MKRQRFNLWPLTIVMTFGVSVAIVAGTLGFLWARFGHLVVEAWQAAAHLVGGLL